MISRGVKWLLMSIAIVGFIILSGAVGLAYLSVQKTPLVTTYAPTQLDGADTVNELLSQLQQAFEKRKEGHQVTLTQTQVESLVGVLQRAIPDFKGIVNITPLAGTVSVSYNIKQSGYYINASALVLPDSSLRIEQVQLGDLKVSGGLLLSLIERAVNFYTDSQIVSLALSRIERVSMREGEITLDLGPLDAFISEFDHVASQLSDDEVTVLELLTAY